MEDILFKYCEINDTKYQEGKFYDIKVNSSKMSIILDLNKNPKIETSIFDGKIINVKYECLSKVDNFPVFSFNLNKVLRTYKINTILNEYK